MNFITGSKTPAEGDQAQQNRMPPLAKYIEKPPGYSPKVVFLNDVMQG
jgi:hypothetical protein